MSGKVTLRCPRLYILSRHDLRQRKPVARTKKGPVYPHRSGLDTDLWPGFAPFENLLERVAPRGSRRRHDPIVTRELRDRDFAKRSKGMIAARNDRISIGEEETLSSTSTAHFGSRNTPYSIYTTAPQCGEQIVVVTVKDLPSKRPGTS